MTVRAGIDLSMSSPVICIHDDSKPLTFENCEFYSYGNYSYAKKLEGRHKNIHILKQPKWDCNLERYQRISIWVCSVLKLHNVSKVGIEDYSYSSKGLVFNIAEMTGVVKYELFKRKIPILPIAISDIKKSFSGKGNSGKDKMYASFVSKTGVKLSDVINYGVAGLNASTSKKLLETPYDVKPIDDLVDAFAVLTSHPDFNEVNEC